MGVTTHQPPCQDPQQVPPMWEQDLPGAPPPPEQEEEEEQGREQGRHHQEQSGQDRGQGVPAVEECGDFTQTIHPESRLAQSLCWWCPFFSFPAYSCSSSVLITTVSRCISTGTFQH